MKLRSVGEVVQNHYQKGNQAVKDVAKSLLHPWYIPGGIQARKTAVNSVIEAAKASPFNPLNFIS